MRNPQALFARTEGRLREYLNENILARMYGRVCKRDIVVCRMVMGRKNEGFELGRQS